MKTTLRDALWQHKVQQGLLEISQLHNTMFTFPHSVSQITNGEEFFWYDNQKKDRILIIDYQESLNYLQHNNHWFIDVNCTTA